MMKKNKLYTINRFNKPMFMPRENLFDGLQPGTSKMNFTTSPRLPNIDWSNTVQRAAALGTISGIGSGYKSMLDAANPFADGNLTKLSGLAGVGSNGSLNTKAFDGIANGAIKSGGIGKILESPIAGAAISAGAGVLGTFANNAISGGLSSGAGNAIGSLGSTIGGAVSTANPLLGAAITFGANTIGGLFNRAFGSKINEENVALVKQKAAELNKQGNIAAGSQTNADVLSNWGNADLGFNFSKKFIGEDGWFSSAASEKYAEMKRLHEAAKRSAIHGLSTGVHNADTNMDNDVLASYHAFGGPLDNNVGAIGYNLMSDYLDTKRKNSDNKNQMTNLFMGTPKTFFDFGGDLQTHGGDFGTGLTHVNAGKSHEENPYDGVQMGVDSEGTPNLVEEGEVIYNDYVYSQRITLDDEAKKKFKFPKKKDITYADAAKKLEKEIAERPNDPISQAGFEAQMQTLADAQERQKAEMEAQRAKEAFEALSPEEQTAIMQQAAQQEAMAQEAAVQQPIPEEVAMAEQQAMQADGTEANLGTEPPMMAEGGHLFKNGSYLWDKFWSPVNEYSKKKGNAKNKYQIDKTYKDDIKKLENSEAYKAFTDYILNNATDEERLKYFQWIDANTGKENKYLDKDGKLVKGWQDAYKAARNDGLYGIQHYTPEWQETVAEAQATPQALTEEALDHVAKIHHAMDGDDYDGYIEGELDPNVVGDEVRRETLPNGDTVIYHARKAPAATTDAEDELDIEPIKKSDWMRYAGLFGPAVGLGMMAAGVGKPDYSKLDAAIEGASNVHLADYKPLGDYLTYRPMDIWYEQNRMDAQARATDRALANSTSPSKMAGLLANGYNSQLASGELYRKALEYNDANRKQVAEFNRGTNQFNAEAYNRNSQFNADAQNRANQYRAGLAMQAASERLNRDAGWYNSLYGNINGLFRGLSDLGRENRETNWRNALVTSGALGIVDPEQLVRAGVAKKKGKKGLTV